MAITTPIVTNPPTPVGAGTVVFAISGVFASGSSTLVLTSPCRNVKALAPTMSGANGGSIYVRNDIDDVSGLYVLGTAGTLGLGCSHTNGGECTVIGISGGTC